MKEWWQVQVPQSAKGLDKSPEMRTIATASQAATLLAPSFFGMEVADKIQLSPEYRLEN